MALTPINKDLVAGLAGHYKEDVNALPDPLITGDIPPLMGTDELIAPSMDLAALTVVGFNGTGQIVPAVMGTTQAIGVLAYAVVTDADDTEVHAGVYRWGVFNPELLVWDASYATDENKRTAFYGAPSPTSVLVRKPQTLTV